MDVRTYAGHERASVDAQTFADGAREWMEMGGSASSSGGSLTRSANKSTSSLPGSAPVARHCPTAVVEMLFPERNIKNNEL